MDLIWLIPLLPGVGAAVNGLVGIRYFSKRAAGLLAAATMLGSFVLSVNAFLQLLGTSDRYHKVTVATWIPPIPLETVNGMGSFEVPWAFVLDPLSSMMLLIVTGIGFLIHVYSIGYIDHEPRPGVARFFCYLNLFCFFMLTLVLGSNFLVMFVGWEGVGLCSYLLIGYWYKKQSASDAGKKAFITNRIGDWGFVMGVFLVYFTFGTLDFRGVAEAASTMPVETAAVGFGVVSLICLFLFVGATGKSAQIPLYVWLPDAMEGPTPVSALIHAATMVTAGVYMVCRNAVLFTHAPIVMEIIAVVGVLTALMAATIGLVQTDIKRVLAYSTVSQLGYMFLATGVGAFAAAAFHLMTHAFFKALLFLGSGSVIHGMNEEQYMRKMGGLKLHMPVTFVTMFIGAIAIAGIPPFAGFFSKDEILYRTFLHSEVLWGLGVVTAAMTAFYMFRLINMTFFGSYRGPAWDRGGHQEEGHDGEHGGAWHGPHESPTLMTVPLMVLSLGAIIAGFIGIPAALGGSNAIEHFLEPSFVVAGAPHVEEVHHMSHAAEIGLMLFSVLIAVGGIWLAYRNYVKRPENAVRMAESWSTQHRLLTNKYYVDELYDSTVIRGTMGSADGLWTVDKRVVDGTVNGTGWTTLAMSWISHVLDKYVVDGFINFVAWVCSEASYIFRRAQTGLIQNYAFATLLGVFAFVTWFLFAQ